MSVTAVPLRRFVWSALLSLIVGLAGCTNGSSSESSSKPPESSSGGLLASATDDAVAVVGGKTITRSELTDRLLAGYGAEVLRELMLHEAVSLEAAGLGLTVSEEELDRELRKMSEGYESEKDFYISMMQQLGMDREAVREDAKYRILIEKLATRDVRIAEADIKRYYEEHKMEYGPRKQYSLAWILTNTKEDADSVLGQLEAGTTFGELAGRYSIDEITAENGGDLGWVDEQDPLQDPKLISAASRLQVGEAAGPIKTDQGYAVLELNGEKTIRGKDYSSVREEIRMLLAMEKAKSVHDLEQTLLTQYEAKILDPRLQLPTAK